MMFRILKFTAPADAAAPRPRTPKPRPGPSTNLDNAFWFEGGQGAQAAHPAVLVVRGAAPSARADVRTTCHSLEWDTVEASGKGTVYSFVVNHYPQVPSFDYPLPVGLIELEEGTRLVANIVGIEPDAVEIGMAVEVEFVDHDDELTLPAVPARCGG